MLAQHSITADEYDRILAALGRVPSLTELGIYSVMWSEHCSYKSSRVHLKRLPTKSDRVVQGPGENAGIIDVGDGWACAFKIESHNHPSYIEPFQGAATGVGGILRDIFTMGARPLAVMDSLRFGPIAPKPGSDEEAGSSSRRNHSIVEGVVSGIAGYGNCFGVPNLGGETKFEACYSGNPLVNAFALGLVRKDEIFYGKATGAGNPVIYVGAKTGRDGIHGATMASEEFTRRLRGEAAQRAGRRPLHGKAAAGSLPGGHEDRRHRRHPGHGRCRADLLHLRDGRARRRGPRCRTRPGSAARNRHDRLRNHALREPGAHAAGGRKGPRRRSAAASSRSGDWTRVIVGTVQPEPRLRIRHHGVLVADIPNQSLTDDAPLYHRPIGTWKAPVPLDPPEADAGRAGRGPRLHGRPEEAAGQRQRLLQALGPRAVRHHGADQHRASAPAAKPA